MKNVTRPRLDAVSLLSESFDGAQDERRGVNIIVDFPFMLRISKHSELSSATTTPSPDLAPNTHGEPNCFRTGLLNSMFHMARNRHIITLFHAHELSLFELQGRFPPGTTMTHSSSP